MGEHKCGHCGKGRFSVRGLRSHISQTPECRLAFNVMVSHTIALGDSDPMDVDNNPGLSEPWAVDNPLPNIDMAGAVSSDPPEPVANPHRVTVEEVEDEDSPGGLPKKPWVGEFPYDVATIIGEGKTRFEELLAQNQAAGINNFAPFADREDWELASWLVKSGLSQEAIDDYLTLPIVRVVFAIREPC